MRVVFDTNILISNTLYGGVCGQVVKLALSGKVESVSSRTILAEFRATLVNKFSLSPLLVDAAIADLKQWTRLVDPKHAIHVLADEPDNRIIEAAVAGECDCIVTGDKAFLKLKSYKTIAILSPNEFLSKLAV